LTAEIEISGQFFRIAQEAASNAIRHGKATEINIVLEGAGGKILLSVTDNGVGLAPDARAKNGMGLRIMDYRARLMGAKFDIQNLPAGGTRVVCILNPTHSNPEFYAAQN
jgi:signal transduction histidine kinase